MAFCRSMPACFIGYCLLVLLLSTAFPYATLAQSITAVATQDTTASPSTPSVQDSSHLAQSATAAISSSTPDTPTFSDDYGSYFLLPTGTRSSSFHPTGLESNPTSSSRPSNDDNSNDDDSPSGVLNYYFLLIAIFIIIVITAYVCVARRKRRKITQLRNNRQDALAQDLEGWSGNRRFITGRWRAGAAEPRVEEGLNERGEAPPPYMPQMPEPSHAGVSRASDGIELRDVRKPPEYEARSPSSKPDERRGSGERTARSGSGDA